MTLITTTRELAELCAELAREPFVALDTEFMRDRTYFPKLCLIQLAGERRHAAVDPLASDLDLAPLFALLADPAVLKVFHAARQDIEIFYHLTGQVPAPLFDTQLAAMVCGYGEEVGYDTLVAQLAKARIDKSSRFTDWARRPLSSEQLAYALADVTYLRVVYRKLSQKTEDAGRSAWVAQELAELTDPKTYRQAPDEAWKRIKLRSRDPRFLAIVQALAAWRERTAQARDLPRNRVIRDDLLLEVAANRPTSPDELARLRRISLDRKAAAAAVDAVRAALALPEAELPQLEPPPKAPRGLGPMVELLRVLLKLQCEEHHVAQRLVATSADLEAIAVDDAPEVAALKGWRYEVFGRAALALKRGAIGLAIRDGRLTLVPMPDPALPAAERLVTERDPGRILIVGRGSFLAGHVLSALPAARVRAVGHDEIERPDLLDGIACVVNFARHPLLGSADYRPETMDPDLRLARRLGERAIAYVMLSSRKVYAPSAQPLAESDADRARRSLRPPQARGRGAAAGPAGRAADGLAPRQRLRLRARAGAAQLPVAVARPPGGRGRDPLRHEPVRRARLPAGRELRAAARRDRAGAAGRRAQRRLGHRPADRPPRALAPRGLRPRPPRDRRAARARRLRARRRAPARAPRRALHARRDPRPRRRDRPPPRPRKRRRIATGKRHSARASIPTSRLRRQHAEREARIDDVVRQSLGSARTAADDFREANLLAWATPSFRSSKVRRHGLSGQLVRELLDLLADDFPRRRGSCLQETAMEIVRDARQMKLDLRRHTPAALFLATGFVHVPLG